MLTKIWKSLFIGTIAMMIVGSGFAQPGNGRGFGPRDGRGICQAIPDLTDEQRDDIDALRLNVLDKSSDLRNDIAQKRLELRKLETADKPSQSQINAKIEEISALRTDMMQLHAQHRQDVRALLTDQQRIVFDARPRGPRHGKGYGRGNGRGRGCGNGQGYGPGNGRGRW